MKRKKQLLCLILALACVLQSAAFATTYSFILKDSTEYSLARPNNTGIEKDVKFSFDDEGASKPLPTAQKTGYGYNGWTYSSGVASEHSTTKEITKTWIDDNYLSYCNFTIKLFPVFGRWVEWNFENGDTAHRDFVPGYIDGYSENTFELTNEYLKIGKKTMNDFDATEKTKAGYTFSHWSDTQNGTNDVFANYEQEYKFGSDSTVTVSNDGGVVKLYAVWNENTYGLEYLNVFTDATNSNPTTYKKSELRTNPLVLSAPSKDGYLFGGWYQTVENGGTTLGNKVETVTGTSTEYNPWKLYATWKYKLKEDSIAGYVNETITPLTLELDDASMTGATIALAAGSTLPAGLTFENGVISGTPTESFNGTVKFDVTATRTDGIAVDGAEVSINIGTRSHGGGGSAVKRYTVKFETNGAGNVAKQTILKNGKVTEPKALVKEGYDFAGWYTDEEFSKKYDFSSKVTSNFTLYAKWKAADDNNDNDNNNGGDVVDNGNDNNGNGNNGNNENDNNNNGNGNNGNNGGNANGNPFNDVSEDDWFYDDVKYVNGNGFMNGTSSTAFSPNAVVTRGMFVTVIWRMAGKPAVEKKVIFDDVALNAYYADAVIWAKQNGLINGVSETEFAPNDKITREQMATILYRYANYKGYDTTQGGMKIREFEDFESISDYALAPMTWAVNAGIMNGKTLNMINPKDFATRAEAAAAIRKFAALKK